MTRMVIALKKVLAYPVSAFLEISQEYALVNGTVRIVGTTATTTHLRLHSVRIIWGAILRNSHIDRGPMQ